MLWNIFRRPLLQSQIKLEPAVHGWLHAEGLLKEATGSALFLEKAARLARGEDEVAYREYVQCLEILKQYDEAIAQNLAGQKALQNNGKTPSAWFTENLAWAYYLKGDIANAARYAPPGTWVASQIADRNIEIDWKLRLTQLLESWRLSDQKTIRLTLPIDRPYQKLTSARVTSMGREKIRTRKFQAGAINL